MQRQRIMAATAAMVMVMSLSRLATVGNQLRDTYCTYNAKGEPIRHSIRIDAEKYNGHVNQNAARYGRRVQIGRR